MKATIEDRIQVLSQERKLLLDQRVQLNTELQRITTILIENQGALEELKRLLVALPEQEEQKKEGSDDGISSI